MTLNELLLQLKIANTTDILNMAVKKYFSIKKISTYSFTYYSYHPNSLNKLKYDMASPNFDSWHQHYIDEHYEEVDSTLDKIYCSILPTLWDMSDQIKDAKSDKERQMRIDSMKFGAVKGISVPIHGPHEDFACFLIVQMKGETCIDDWKDAEQELLVISYHYYSSLQKILLNQHSSSEKYKLNKREIQCLHLTAKRYSVSKIAQNLNITPRTVNYHIQRLNKKLGTKNKYQSVIKSIKYGLLD